MRKPVRRCGWVLSLALGLVAILPEVAFVSGAFSERYAEPSFTLYYQDDVRKAFKDEDQARRYFREKKTEFERTHREVFESLRRAIARHQKTLPILPADASLPVYNEKSIPTPPSPKYPCQYLFTFEQERGTYSLGISFRAAGKPAALKKFRADLAAVLKKVKNDLEPVDIDAEPPSLADLPPEIAVRERYAVYVLLPHHLQPGSESHFRPQVAAVTAKLCRIMDQALTDPAFLKSLKNAPQPLAPALQAAKAKGFDEETIFRPWGPSLADDMPGLVSVRGEAGEVMIVVLMSFQEFDWAAVSQTIGAQITKL